MYSLPHGNCVVSAEDHLKMKLKLSFRAAQSVGKLSWPIGYCHFLISPCARSGRLKEQLSVSDSGVTVGVSNRLKRLNFMISHRDIRKLTVCSRLDRQLSLTDSSDGLISRVRDRSYSGFSDYASIR